jgi:putative phage-type endonuclease
VGCHKIIDSDDRSAWLDARKLGFGASDAASIMGVGWNSPSELWAIKRGVMEADNLDDNEMVHWGNVLESVVATQYATPKYAGREVELSGVMYQSEQHPQMLATLDAWTEHPVHGRIPLEIKTVTQYRAEDWAEGPPEKYWWQVQQQILVTDTPMASIACLIGGQQLVWCDVERDEFALRRLVAEADKLWTAVLNSDAPPYDPSEGGKRVLGHVYPLHSDSEVVLPGEFMTLADELEMVKAQAKEANARRTAIENAIRLEMKDAERATLANGARFTLKTQTRPASTSKESSFRVLRFKAPKGQ